MRINQQRSDVSDEDLRLVADSAHDFAMIFTDTERKVIRWSKGAENILGWTEAEVIGKDERDLIFTPEDQAAGIPQQEPDIALREGRAVDDRWHMKKDGTRFFARGIVTPLYNRDTGALRGFGKVLLDQTREKRLEEELHRLNDSLEERVAKRTEQLMRMLEAMEATRVSLEASLTEREASLAERQDLLRRVVTTEEMERRRISRELHDQTGQHLTGLALGLKALEDTILAESQPNEGVNASLTSLRRVADDLARDLHHIAVELRPTALDDLGLLSALSSQVQRWSESTTIPAEFDSFGLDGEESEANEERLPEVVETTVYRVVQEALTNVARHGNKAATRATRVSVTIQRRVDQLRVTVEDNGPGFDVAAAKRGGRLGIAGMRERAEACGGTLVIESEIGKGTTIFLRIPMTGGEASGPMNQTETADLLRRAATFARDIFELDDGEAPGPDLVAEALVLSLALDNAALKVETKTLYQRLREVEAEVEAAEERRDTQQKADRVVRRLLGGEESGDIADV
jgi:PAS domain S-box-containing protein